jgi:hypothetical protein
MKIHLRKYFSLFLLTLFLFPQIEKNVHDLKHTTDFHCKATDEHFHQAQHTCPICEFTVPAITVPAEQNTEFSFVTSSDFVLSFNETKLISLANYFVSLRGPPVVS